jgi:pimeloyl-ACP methyl ester carboxylesterase
MDAYQIEPAYQQFPLRGAADSKGIVIWNHGVNGTKTQYQYPPPLLISGLAARGWDVVQLERNPTYENTWTNAGLKHVDRLIEEAAKARKDGYPRIILAGQSYGGAIALQAADTVPVYAVIAMAPGTGTTARWFGAVITEADSPTIEKHTYEQVEGLKTQRAVFVLPSEDEFAPGIDRAPHVRELMDAKSVPYLLFDHEVRGHGAGYSRAFFPYAGCALWLLDPDTSPAPGRHRCFTDEIRTGLVALGVDATGATRAWFGYGNSSGQIVALIERAAPSGDTADFLWGADLSGKDRGGKKLGLPITRDGGAFSFAISDKARFIVHTKDGGADLSDGNPDKAKSFSATLVPIPK